MYQQVRLDVGDVSMLFNNAGIVSGSKLLSVSDEKIQLVMDVNTTSHFWVRTAPDCEWRSWRTTSPVRACHHLSVGLLVHTGCKCSKYPMCCAALWDRAAALGR